MKVHIGWAVVILAIAAYFFYVHYKSTGKVL